MNERIMEMAREAGLHINGHTSEERAAACARFAQLVAEDFVEFVQDYPHWLGREAKREMIAAIRARYNR